MADRKGIKHVKLTSTKNGHTFTFGYYDKADFAIEAWPSGYIAEIKGSQSLLSAIAEDIEFEEIKNEKGKQ